MNQIIKMAFRDLLRNKRRTILSMLALAMGLSILILMASTVTGEMRGAMVSTVNLESGNLQVRIKGYNPDKASLKWTDLIENPNTIVGQLTALAPVKIATPRLFASGIITQGDQSVGVSVMGIDPPSLANQPFRDGLVSGQFLTADDSNGIMVGQTLANKIKVKSGDSIILLVNTSNGDVDQQSFTIRGIYNTHTPSFDQLIVLMPLLKTQTITRAENHASIIFVLLKDSDQTNVVATALQSSQYEVKTSDQLNQLLVTYQQLANSYMYLLYLIVLAITATVIVNTLVMSVFERTREIGILAAIGMKSSRIMLMFFTESAMLAVGGIVMGLILGELFNLYATYIGFYLGNFGVTGFLLGETIYGYLTVSDTVVLTILAFVITLLAALYPAILAARMEPVEALHGGKLA